METDYAVHPGEFLEEWMEDEQESIADIAGRLGWSEEKTEKFMGGHCEADLWMRLDLGRLFGNGADFWWKIQRRYEYDCKRLGFTPHAGPQSVLDGDTVDTVDDAPHE